MVVRILCPSRKLRRIVLFLVFAFFGILTLLLIFKRSSNPNPDTGNDISTLNDGVFISKGSLPNHAVKLNPNDYPKLYSHSNRHSANSNPNRDTGDDISTLNDDALRKRLDASHSSVSSESAHVNVQIWRGLCETDIASLKRSSFFPSYPDEQSKKSITKFELEDNSPDYGQQILGFLTPPATGSYRFAIASDDTSELWLSSSEDSNNKLLIAQVFQESEPAWTTKNQLDKYPGQISKSIELHKGSKYYIEVIHIQGIGDGFVQVYWARPKENDFELISGEHLLPYSHSDLATTKKEVLQSPFSGRVHDSFNQKYKRNKEYLRFLSLPFLPEENYLPICSYKSSLVLQGGKVAQYKGYQMVYQSSVYPSDDSVMAKGKSAFIYPYDWPNLQAEPAVIQEVADKIASSLRHTTNKEYILKKIHKVTQKSDPVYGERFSVDLEIGLNSTDKSFRLSEHVFNRKVSNALCFPEGIEWNRKTTVYFILPVKDQGKWVRHFINELTAVSLLTGDTNFQVIVVDFQSRDIDMAKAFNTSLLHNRHTIITLEGRFYKTLALNKAVERVPSTRDLLFLFDLHIDLPVDILENVRKNTIEGRIAYFPVVGRLDCGSNHVEHRGFWEMDGYGLLAIYKSDWIKFGGMNTKDYQYKWGGEDSDLLDRVVNAGMEVERIRYPGLYHHHHSKQKLWN